MGENARRISDDEEIKIGTCEAMYYIRYEDRNKVAPAPHSLDCSTCMDLFWRLPFPKEDGILPGDYKDPEPGFYLPRYDGTEIEDQGIVQYENGSGLYINVKCYHGLKLPESNDDLRAFWNGKSSFFELAFVKNTKEGMKAVVRCKYCGHMWREEIDDIIHMIYDTELQKRLWNYVHSDPIDACSMCSKIKGSGKGCCSREFQDHSQEEEYDYDAPRYPAIRYGREKSKPDVTEPCPSCKCEPGTYHHTNCPDEECPVCNEKAVICKHYRCYDLGKE